MKLLKRLPLIIALLIILISESSSQSKPITWHQFTKDLLAVSNLHLNLPLTKSALKDAKNSPISKAEALYLVIEALGLGFEAGLLQDANLINDKELPKPIIGALNLVSLINPPLVENKRWMNPKVLRGKLDTIEAKALIERALSLKTKGGRIRFSKRVNKDLELHWERTLNPNLYVCYAKFNPKSKSLRLEIELAGNQVQNREKLSDICKRKNAILGINGGFFKIDGEPVGALMIDGVLISEPTLQRGCFGWNERGKFIFGKTEWEGALESQESRLVIKIDGLNRKPVGDELILYTSFYGDYVDTKGNGTVVTVRKGGISSLRESSEREPIPNDGFIVIGYGEKGRYLSNLVIGERLAVKAFLIPEKASPIWREVRFLIQGGPTLIYDGKITNYDENFNESLLNKKHPRTIIGETDDGNLILMVIDGRNPNHSEGLTIEELKMLLKNMGLKNALNLDGGGSSTFYFNGRLYNTPSDGKEREISYALILLKD